MLKRSRIFKATQLCRISNRGFHTSFRMQGDYNVSSYWSIHLLVHPFSLVAQAAVAALNTLQSNFSIVDAIRKSGRGMNKNAIPEMLEWVKRLGYEVCVPPCRLSRPQPTHCSLTIAFRFR